ncbi:ATP-grasp domain-containing protein [Candidatus Saccharibacteria bacterium]|nr:ATP-grasp domain-containing protein [Candidatus Saccharibacteria bacterium]
MNKQPLRIEIVRSSSKKISSLSEKSAIEIIELLSRHYTDVVTTNIDSVSDMRALIERKPDLVFTGIYYVTDQTTGAKVWLSAELERHGIAHTGSNKFSNRLSLNKNLAKEQLQHKNIKTAAFKLASRQAIEPFNETGLRFPLFVKPNNKSGGQGIDEFSIVRTADQLHSKINSIHTRHFTDALVEEYLEGREFSVAVITNRHTNQLMAMPIEIVATKDGNGERMLGNIIKNLNIETSFAVDDKDEHQRLSTFAAAAFRALGGRNYGRIDVRLDKDGAINFLEANLIPGLIGDDNYFPKAYRLNLGFEHEEMLVHIVQLALNHKTKRILSL